MFMIMLALFITVPLLELLVIIEIGSWLGYGVTILVLLVISVAGAALAKRQGYAVVARIQDELRFGKMPGDSLIDGAMILAGALLLLTPGYITDTAGLLLLLPPVRRVLRPFAKRRLRRAVERKAIRILTPDEPYGPDSNDRPYEPEQRRKELED